MLSLEPTHAEAQARLHEVRQQQELATWYATGQQHYDAGQWQAALEDFRRVQEHGGNYKDVEALLATAQRELARVRDEEQRRLSSAALYREAQTALAREDWTAATEQLQAVLTLEPTHAEAQARLHEVRQQQELATWYATASSTTTPASGRRPWRTSGGCRRAGAIIRTWRRCWPRPNANWRG